MKVPVFLPLVSLLLSVIISLLYGFIFTLFVSVFALIFSVPSSGGVGKKASLHLFPTNLSWLKVGSLSLRPVTFNLPGMMLLFYLHYPAARCPPPKLSSHETGKNPVKL